MNGEGAPLQPLPTPRNQCSLCEKLIEPHNPVLKGYRTLTPLDGNAYWALCNLQRCDRKESALCRRNPAWRYCRNCRVEKHYYLGQGVEWEKFTCRICFTHLHKSKLHFELCTNGKQNKKKKCSKEQ